MPPQTKGETKPYAEVITDKAKTTEGIFTVHRVGEKVYYQIPDSALGRDMLLNTEIAQTAAGVGFAGSPTWNTRVVRWERRGTRIYLRNISFDKRGSGSAGLQRAIDASSLAPIIMAFDIETFAADSTPVIEVTKFFSTDVPDITTVGLFEGMGLMSPPNVDASRTYIDQVKVFPLNIEVRSLFTYNLGTPFRGSGPPRPSLPGGVRSVSALIHYSMVLLPKEPMQARLFDPRVGYFTESFEDYGPEQNRVRTQQYITRYRLQKKYPDSAISEPLKPIVYYISREVPEEWRPFMRLAIEDWNEAFEAAGFRNAIVARDAPTVEEDSLWDPEDTRYSVIRWVTTPVANAMGPHVHDPRSGEIISAHIIVWHNVLRWIESNYFALCSSLDPRAQRFPLPREVMGELIRYVTAHEVGHTLGLRHNHKASSAYTTQQLRDPVFTAANGTTASIMSYGRYNYVAQPEDHVKRLIPRIGPYDRFAIAWGYHPIPGVTTPEGERADLDSMAARQITEPFLRFGGEDGPSSVDPTVKTENIGSDPIESTEMGLRNLERTMAFLVDATSVQGEDYSMLSETYNYLLSVRQGWLYSVADMLGGVVETRYLAGRGGETFARVPKIDQQRAMKFLLDSGLATPQSFLKPAIINRFKYYGVADAVMNRQQSLLTYILSARRYKLLLDAEILTPRDAYTMSEFFSDVQNGVWSELSGAAPVIDPFRRNLQRRYISHLKSQLDAMENGNGVPEFITLIFGVGDPSRMTDFRALARSSLRDLGQRIDGVVGRTKDRMSLAHLRDCRMEITRILDPRP